MSSGFATYPAACAGCHPAAVDPGEANLIDWSYKVIKLHGLPVVAKVLQMWLAYSRIPIVRTYSRETQKMVSTRMIVFRRASSTP
jgi:hypothetical protein